MTVSSIDVFEKLVARLSIIQPTSSILDHEQSHPFEVRDVHPDLPVKVKDLFDDGHYSQATFEACKYLDNLIKKYAPNTKSGEARMMGAFDENKPLVKLNSLVSESEKDEQRGYKFLFAGTMVAIRNPRGHEETIVDDPLTCLDHLALVSALIRKIDKARENGFLIVSN